MDELSEKILPGITKALNKLVESSAAANKELMVGDKDENVKSVPAKELLHFFH